MYSPKQSTKRQVDNLVKALKEEKKKTKVKTGDWVCLNKMRRTFKKGYLPNWSEELFSVVCKQDGSSPLYIIQDYNGEVIEGAMYPQEIQKVIKSDALYRV